MSKDISDSNIDVIFTEVGAFGLFQIVTYLLISIPNIISATYVVNYIISANTLDYRCKIDECEFGANNREIEYDKPWLSYAVPHSNGKMQNCERYAPILRNVSKSTIGNDQCTADMFDTSRQIECSQYVYASDERNVQTEFDIHYSDSYKLALIGTANNMGRMIFLPITGFLSDKFGRLTVIIIGTFISSIFGLIKSFSTSYLMYIIMEFMESSAGICTYAASYVLAIEWASSKYRVLGSTFVNLSFSSGGILMGVVAMYIHDFRTLIRVLYSPGLAVVIYFWLVPESIQWLLVTGKVDRAIKILQQIASTNGKRLSKESIESIKSKYSLDSIPKSSPTDNENDQNTGAREKLSLTQSIYSIFQSKTLCLRFLNCCYQWVTLCFCYYGLGMMSTHVHGENRYMSFILVASFEIPGIFTALFILNRMKRRILLCGALTVIAISTNAIAWIPAAYSTLTLLMFMLGKAASMCGFNILYLYTAEQWPTNLRNFTMNSCSMVGRLGAMAAPMTVILGAQYGSLPVFLFSGVAMIGAVLVFFSPETYQKKLPETIEEAKQLS